MLLLAIILCAQSVMMPAAVHAQGETVDVFGYYFIVGRAPRGFEDIGHLHLATIDARGRPAPLSGLIRMRRRSARDFRILRPTLSGNDLTFTTTAVGGTRYRFAGRFARLGDFPNSPPDASEVILTGTLTKISGGRTVASSNVRFRYEAGD